MDWLINLLSYPQVQEFLVDYAATMALDQVPKVLVKAAKALRMKPKKVPIDIQLLNCLSEALSKTKDCLGWEKDVTAITETFLGDLSSFYGSFNKEGLQKIFNDAVGHEVTESDIACFIENLKKHWFWPNTQNFWNI